MARASVFNSVSCRSSRDSAAGLRGLHWRERCSTSQLILPTELTHTPHRELRSGDTGQDAARRTNGIAAVASCGASWLWKPSRGNLMARHGGWWMSRDNQCPVMNQRLRA